MGDAIEHRFNLLGFVFLAVQLRCCFQINLFPHNHLSQSIIVGTFQIGYKSEGYIINTNFRFGNMAKGCEGDAVFYHKIDEVRLAEPLHQK